MSEVLEIGKRARTAAASLALVSTEVKNDALGRIADLEHFTHERSPDSRDG